MTKVGNKAICHSESNEESSAICKTDLQGRLSLAEDSSLRSE